MNKIASKAALLALFHNQAFAYFKAVNLGGDGTGRDKAQTYHMAGGRDAKMTMKLNLYDKSIGPGGFEFHGDVVVSVVGALDKELFDMGWCFRPLSEVDNNASTMFDCISVRWYYDHKQIDKIGEPGHSESYLGYDLYAPRLDPTHMLPIDLTTKWADDMNDSTANTRAEVLEVLKNPPAVEKKKDRWTVNTSKSYKTCPSNGNCTFNFHFFRNFETLDDQDYQLT